MAKRTVNMREVDQEIRSRKRSKRVPEGEYLLKVMEGTWGEGEEYDYVNWRFQIVKGVGGKKYAGVTLYTITSMSPKSLWNLRNLIFAAKGKNMAGKAFNFDPETLVGSVVGSTVEDDEYKPEGKAAQIRSRPVDFYPKDKYEEPDTEEEDSDEEDSDDTEETETEDVEEELEDIDVDEDL